MTTPTLYTGALINEQQTRTLIRDWEVYLRARLLLLTPADPLRDSFEQEAHTAHRTTAAQDLAAIPSESRTLFEHAVTNRRELRRGSQETAQRIADPDHLDRLVVAELLIEVTEPDETGHILVPTQADHGAVDWLEFRAADLAARPDDRTYRGTGARAAGRERLKRIVMGIAAVVLTLWAIWMFFQPDAAPAARRTSGATLNGTPVPAWRATTLTITADTPASWPLTLASSTWPTDGQAHSRAGGMVPLRACVPLDALTTITAVQIAGDGSTPDRRYTIVADATAPAPDLLLSPCGDAATRIRGVLLSDAAPTLATVGSTQRLGTHDVALAAVRVQGAAESPDVPQGAARVILTLNASGVDWTARAPTLRLGDGSQQSAPDVQTTDQGATEIRFLISVPRETLPAEFRLTDPATRHVVRWMVTLPPPPDRLRVLQSALVVAGVTASGSDRLDVTIRNRSTQLLTLTAADLLLDVQGMRNPLTAVSGIDTPLAAGETRTLTLSLPSDLRGGATLSLGTAHYQITP